MSSPQDFATTIARALGPFTDDLSPVNGPFCLASVVAIRKARASVVANGRWYLVGLPGVVWSAAQVLTVLCADLGERLVSGSWLAGERGR